MPKPSNSLAQAQRLMEEFASRTGLTGDGEPVRYLWTDAFAVCNYIGLAGHTKDDRFNRYARALIDQVHSVLGRHRADDERQGWLSGLSDEQAKVHPTLGGLRIGKPEPERGADEPADEQQEWNRDGQYFHYLTKWMHALDQFGHFTNEKQFNRWAGELAQTACKAFVYRPRPESTPRMYWKMSIDLQRPLVATMGQHDPLDGYITCLQLQTRNRQHDDERSPDLSDILSTFQMMTTNQDWITVDPLGLGGLLIDAYRSAQLARAGAELEPLTNDLLDAAHAGLFHYARSDELEIPAAYRLAFRELGLAVGLDAIEHWLEVEASHAFGEALEQFKPFLSLRDAIVSFWAQPDHQLVASWQQHRDINSVMLATALAPEGFVHLY